MAREADRICKEYFDQNDRFSDLVNFTLYNGKEVTKPSDFITLDPVISEVFSSDKSYEVLIDNLKELSLKEAVRLDNTVREYHYGYGHGYHRLNGIVSALERYIDFSQENYITKMTQTQAMRILSVAAQDPSTEATSMTQYSVIYNAKDASATIWLHQDYDTAYNLVVE